MIPHNHSLLSLAPISGVIVSVMRVGVGSSGEVDFTSPSVFIVRSDLEETLQLSESSVIHMVSLLPLHHSQSV